MLRGAMPVAGSISMFLGDFFLYWPLVSPYSSGRSDEYRTGIKRKGMEEAGKKESRTEDSRSLTQVFLSIY